MTFTVFTLMFMFGLTGQYLVSILVSPSVSEPVLLYANVFHTTCNKTNNDKVKYFNGHNPCRVKPFGMATV